MTDWIEWKGGERPVPPGTWVEIRYRSGETETDGATMFGWGHYSTPDNASWDIVAYRVVSDPAKSDPVNSPSHYTDGGIEAIDYIRAKLGPDGFRSYCLGNVLKYVSRAGKKGDAGEDLKKAKVYLEWAIND